MNTIRAAYFCKEKVHSTRLLHCPAVVSQNSASSLASCSSSFLKTASSSPPPPAVVVPSSGDLTAVVRKLRQMTSSVEELRVKLGKALESKIQQQIEKKTDDQKIEISKIKLTRF
jgi:hypothetical protein